MPPAGRAVAGSWEGCISKDTFPNWECGCMLILNLAQAT